MNARQPFVDSTIPVALSISFSADKKLFSVGLQNGYAVFDSTECKRLYNRGKDFGMGIGCAEIIGRSSVVALVGGGRNPKYSQNQVMLYDEKKNADVFWLNHRTDIQRVRVTKTHIAVALLNWVHVYKLPAGKSKDPSNVKLASYETTNNPYGLCCLGPQILAFPGRSPGHVQIVQLDSLNVSIIPAHHNSPLRAVEMSDDGTLIATASEQGTLVRVWSSETCSKVSELRRGVNPATVFSIAISPSCKLLAVTSENSTLHIFDLPHRDAAAKRSSESPRPLLRRSGSNESLEIIDGEEEPLPNKKWGWLGKIPGAPQAFKDIYSFASAHFEIGEEPLSYQQNPRGSGRSMTWNAPIPGIPGGRPPKGIIAWLDEEVLLVVGAGQDARWEMFRIEVSQQGKKVCYRTNWRWYLR